MSSREERLQQIYDETGRPGAQAFRFAVRRAGLELSDAEARAFVAKQSSAQIFRGRLPSDGKVPGGGRENMRWQCDVLDFSKKISKLNNQNKYVLVCVDLYTREAFTEAMPNKSAQTTLEAFRRIIAKNGGQVAREITVDNGNEYALFEKEIGDRGVLRRKDEQAINTLAIVDRVIAGLKTILSSYSLTNWAESLQRATKAYNNRSHDYLMGSAPSDVKGSALLKYELDKNNGEAIAHNNKKWRAKAGRLNDEESFRIPMDRSTWERIDAPKFQGEVLPVTGFKGSHVLSNDKSYPVKNVLAVQRGSAQVDLDDGLAGPNQGRREKQREVLGPYAKELHRQIPSEGLTLGAARSIIQGMRSAVQDMEIYGPPAQGRYASFFRLFPKLFKIVGSGPGMRLMKADPPAPRESRPAGGASSSTDRTPRAMEVNRRAAYRRFPNETRVVYEDRNPARPNSERYKRYEAYSKKAKTIGEARRLGASSQDISQDLAAGALKLL